MLIQAVADALCAEFGTCPVAFEGAIIVALASPVSATGIREGDLYIARSEFRDWELLTCERTTNYGPFGSGPWVVLSQEREVAPFSEHHCRLVIDIIDNNT